MYVHRRCEGCVQQIRSDPAMAHAIPASVTDEQATAVLAALNTNSHQLENLGGSGLFQVRAVCRKSAFAPSLYPPQSQEAAFSGSIVFPQVAIFLPVYGPKGVSHVTNSYSMAASSSLPSSVLDFDLGSSPGRGNHMYVKNVNSILRPV